MKPAFSNGGGFLFQQNSKKYKLKIEKAVEAYEAAMKVLDSIESLSEKYHVIRYASNWLEAEESAFYRKLQNQDHDKK